MKRSLLLALALSAASAGLALLPDRSEGAPPPPPEQGAAEVAPLPDPRGPLFDFAQIRPHFAEGPLARARARFAEGRWSEALRLFTEHDDGSPQVALMRGFAALELGRAEEAAQILAPLPELLPAIADRVRWNLGLALERMGDAAGAAEAFAAVPPTSVRHDEARLARARALEKLGRLDEALEVLAPLREKPAPAWGNDHGATALFHAGELHLRQGNRDAARAAWLRLWSEHPLAPQAEDARQRADALGGPGPSLAQRVERAKRFLDAHKNREGTDQIAELLPRLQLPDPLACEAHYALGRGYRKMREHRRAIPILEAVAARCADPSIRVRALYVLGQSTTIVAPEKAFGVYETIVADFPDHAFADDALLFLAELHDRAGDAEATRAALQRLVDGYPEGDYRADALFRLFWTDRKAGARRRALEALRLIERDYGDAPDATALERSLYWQGRVLVELDRPVEAAATWEKLVREHPAGYYAMLARGRLGDLSPDRAVRLAATLPAPREEDAPPALHEGTLGADPRFRAALELLRLGFPALATEELLRIDRAAARAAAGGSHEPVLLIAWLLDRAEARRAAHHIARTELRELIRGRPEGDALAHFRIAYPLAFRDLIERHAAEHGVPPDLMQALMREESSLDPQVVSWAGAVGLTQLMPSTARAVAQRLKLPPPSARQLRDPDLNVRLGTAYLGQLLRRWDGNPALAAASYNAGPGAVARWLRERGHLELDEFVEEIPIEETRNYVKRVLDSFTTYRLAWGEGEERFVAFEPVRADGRALR